MGLSQSDHNSEVTLIVNMSTEASCCSGSNMSYPPEVPWFILGSLYYITTCPTYQRIIEFCSIISHRFIVHVPNFIQSRKRFNRICNRLYKVDIKISNANYTNPIKGCVDSFSLSAGWFVVFRCIEILPCFSKCSQLVFGRYCTFQLTADGFCHYYF